MAREKQARERGWRRSKIEVVGEFSKLFRNTCSHCGQAWMGRTRRKYCKSHFVLYGDEGRNLFEFTFNPFHYPDIFSADALAQLSALGFWRPDNRHGLTRDHRVSVNEAIRNSYDVFYIKHPLNCELMGWQENNVKNTNSSMSYVNLVRLVDAYEETKAIETTVRLKLP